MGHNRGYHSSCGRKDRRSGPVSYTHLKDRPPHYLSGGEKKRVCIADIVAMESELFLFDEPTASLDPLNTAVFEAVLDKLWNMGKTLLISTHDVDFAWRWADRALVFAGGRLIADDSPRRIFQDESVVSQANLRKPVLMDVCSRLAAHGLVPDLSLIHILDADTGFEWNRVLAMSLISIIPSLIVFLLAQDQFIDGIAAGGVKG